ncbi:UDP-2,3-diacylglucosamine diphosphatase [Roseobacter sp. MH60115]|uniref:UDP-2,3-diacylglucosamine diphosphatase n=1 Tax=Roseobacter sp. MH60115 TaxID=2785324 RepID=UPI0018A279C4|nr:UDP-2,3-diacylglucosamine diphosphatase [Roseobacter sp. MH60115]
MLHRTIFLSDIHLGTRGCRADLLLDFLNKHDAEEIYLVGDIFDGWALRRGWHWPQKHNDVVQLLLKKTHNGTRVVFIPGNHDEVMRNYLGTHFGGIEVVETADFTAQNGKRYFVTHGDQFDTVVMNAKWLAHWGDRVYAALLWLNPKINRLRSLWSGGYWSLSKWAKRQVKHAVSFISEYESVLAEEARRGGYDGVICGHIHHANIRKIGEITYVNTGDWVESCTAVVERADGTLELFDWEARAAATSSVRRRRRLARIKARKKDLVETQT